MFLRPFYSETLERNFLLSSECVVMIIGCVVGSAGSILSRILMLSLGM